MYLERLDELAREEEIRKAVHWRLRTGTVRGVASEIGISRRRLQSFLTLGVPRFETWERLLDWYGDQPEQEVAEGVVHILSLVCTLPAPSRYPARVRLAHDLLTVYGAVDAQPPGWLIEETEVVGRALPSSV
jgi:hypothetical protein